MLRSIYSAEVDVCLPKGLPSLERLFSVNALALVHFGTSAR
jgi:hypothetical protein